MTAVAAVPGNGRRTTVWSRPQPAAIDATFVLVLTGLGLIGFAPVYGGYAYLVAGGAGALLGVAITELAARLRQPVLAEAAVTVLAFLLLGGATNTVRALIPSAHSITALGHVGIYGWKELLTTAPPVGSGSDLLAIPYIVGLVGGVAGQSLARRTKAVAAPLLGPGLVLALGILFGARQPQSLLLQGSLFGILALVWTVLRYQRTRVMLAGRRFNRDRFVLSVGVLVAVGLLAGLLGPHLPGAGSHQRVVLSKYVAPPFLANQEPSPLAGFRQYVQGSRLYDQTLFTVRGLPPGTPIRIATMDAYNGLAWGFGADTGSAKTSGDVFRRYGSTIQTAAVGRSVHAEVSVGQLGGVWLPEVGELAHISFSGPVAGRLSDSFRYDTDTETAGVPAGLAPGDSYSFTAFDPIPVSSTQVLDGAAAGSVQVPVENAPPVVQSDASSWSADAKGPYARVMAIATHLRTTGYFSDGLEDPQLSVAGHSNGRLVLFLQGGGLVGSEIVGDGEQYAATLALMANSIGVPARVVLGATVGAGGVVKGADVQPWVEVNLAGLGWQPIYASSFMDPSRKAHQTPPTPAPDQPTAAPVQPPVASAVHAPLQGGLPGSASGSSSHFAQPAVHHSHLPAWVVTTSTVVASVVAALLAFTGLIVAIKTRRRRRRRRAATPAGQVAGAWSDLIDRCRDLGIVVPGMRTRSEQASTVGTADLAELARRGDASIFGPGNPSDSEVADYWSAIDQAARQMRVGLGPMRRWRAMVSLRSFTAAMRTS
ncbi:MAG: hypothetical protein KGQ66_18015 [Acidobacteriota bacterium]|nr:hypothetical protein [Acidobacteriota bacterium]